MKKTLIEDNLLEEAKYFNDQIIERVANGHIPDIQNVEDCDYFYNNSWRRKYYVHLDFEDQFELINSSIKSLYKDKKDLNILEVGCGPGYMSLELARQGYNVTGIDISDKCIEVALDTARKYSPHILKNNLSYKHSSLSNFVPENNLKFDVVYFLGSLHHFIDQSKVHNYINKIMKKEKSYFICHEPVRDKIKKSNAIIYHLITTLLKLSGIILRN